MQKLRLRPKFKPRTRFTARYASYHRSSPHDSDIGQDLVADQFQHQEENEDHDFAQPLLKFQFPPLYLEFDQDEDSVSPLGLSALLQEYDPVHVIFLIMCYPSKAESHTKSHADHNAKMSKTQTSAFLCYI